MTAQPVHLLPRPAAPPGRPVRLRLAPPPDRDRVGLLIDAVLAVDPQRVLRAVRRDPTLRRVRRTAALPGRLARRLLPDRRYNDVHYG